MKNGNVNISIAFEQYIELMFCLNERIEYCEKMAKESEDLQMPELAKSWTEKLKATNTAKSAMLANSEQVGMWGESEQA